MAEGRSAASVADLKRSIIEQAGDRSGLDRCTIVLRLLRCGPLAQLESVFNTIKNVCVSTGPRSRSRRL